MSDILIPQEAGFSTPKGVNTTQLAAPEWGWNIGVVRNMLNVSQPFMWKNIDLRFGLKSDLKGHCFNTSGMRTSSSGCGYRVPQGPQRELYLRKSPEWHHRGISTWTNSLHQNVPTNGLQFGMEVKCVWGCVCVRMHGHLDGCTYGVQAIGNSCFFFFSSFFFIGSTCKKLFEFWATW